MVIFVFFLFMPGDGILTFESGAFCFRNFVFKQPAGECLPEKRFSAMKKGDAGGSCGVPRR